MRPDEIEKSALRRCGIPALLAVATAGMLVGTGVEARAQGFGFFEQGTCTMARAGAAVADPCDDASALFFNPAGLAGETGWTLSGGLTSVVQTGDFTADGTLDVTDIESDPGFVPHFYGSYGVTERLAAGVGLYVPYGLNTEWPRDFEGAFVGYDNSLQSIYVQPSVAYRLTDRIRVGGGIIVAVGTVELNQLLDLSEQEAVEGVTFGELGVPRPTAFGETRLDADPSVGVGGNIGVLVEATDRLSFGARFMTPIDIDYTGSASFRQVETGLVLPDDNPLGVPGGTSMDELLAQRFLEGPLVEQGVATEITMPAQVVAGLAFRPVDRLSLMVDYQYTSWSDFDVVRLDFDADVLDEELPQNYEDTNGVRVGAEYEVSNRWTLRGGYIYNEAAAPDESVTPLLPESDRNHVTAGFGFAPTPGLEVNLAYHFLNQNDRRGRTLGAFGDEAPTADLNNGLYSFTGHLVGTTVTLRF